MAAMHFNRYKQQPNANIEHHILSSSHLTLAMECAEDGSFFGAEYHLSYVSLPKEKKAGIMDIAYRNGLNYSLDMAANSIKLGLGSSNTKDHINRAKFCSSKTGIDISDKIKNIERLADELKRTVINPK